MSVASLANRTYTFQRPTVTQDASGGITRTWAKTLRLRGRVQPLKTSDLVMHQQLESLVTHTGYFDGSPDIRAGDRIGETFDGKTLYVTGVRNIDGAARFLTVHLEGRDR